MWQVNVLGPVQIVTADGIAKAGGRRCRAVLAALVIGVDHDLSQDYLVEAVWGSLAPPQAIPALQTHVSKLRQALGHDAIITEDHSYRLVARCRQIDACRFERSVHAANIALPSDPEAARAYVREAVDMWRGAPFGDLADEAFCQVETHRLCELRRAAEEIDLEASLALGAFIETIPRLQAAVADEPYRERRWYLLMHALAQSGRRVEALRTHSELTGKLGDVGLEPPSSFAELAAAIATGGELPPLVNA